MPSHACRGIRFPRPRSDATPNSGLAAHSKEAQKMTPCKNYLAETKPPTGFFARHGVTPCGAVPHTHRQSSKICPDRLPEVLPTEFHSRRLDSIRSSSTGHSRSNGNGCLCLPQTGHSRFAGSPI